MLAVLTRVEQDLVDVPVGVVVGEDRAGEVVLAAGRLEVVGRGADRVDRVVRVLATVVVGVDAVGLPARRDELHPAQRAGRGHVEVGAERGLDPVDRGEHLPRDPVLGSASLVDREEERRDRELVDDEVGNADRRGAEVGDGDGRVRVGRGPVGLAGRGRFHRLAVVLHAVAVLVVGCDLSGAAPAGVAALTGVAPADVAAGATATAAGAAAAVITTADDPAVVATADDAAAVLATAAAIAPTAVSAALVGRGAAGLEQRADAGALADELVAELLEPEAPGKIDRDVAATEPEIDAAGRRRGGSNRRPDYGERDDDLDLPLHPCVDPGFSSFARGAAHDLISACTRARWTLLGRPPVCNEQP